MKSPVSLTCIVPRIPPSIDGVGDYALNLALHLYKNLGLKTNFIVTDSNWVENEQFNEFYITQVIKNSASSLFSSLPTSCISTVLLHYVGYGYARRGCPTWLIEGLENWKAKNSEARLVTMFHEIYATGPPWTSAFWLSPLQRNLAARLAKLSDRVLTSKQGYADILSQLSRGKHTQIPSLPVFSSIGEPERVPPLAERQRQLVVFGGRSKRLRVYQNSQAELSRACQFLGIEKILDIGPSTNYSLSAVNGVPIVELGEQPATQISGILLDSLAGFLDYSTDFLAKSTIFAAYCAHGVLPINARCNALPADGIEPGKHYWIPDGQLSGVNSLAKMQAIANCAHTWYQTHNLSTQAKVFAASLMTKEGEAIEY